MTESEVKEERQKIVLKSNVSLTVLALSTTRQREAYLLVECYGFIFQGSIKPLPVQNIYLMLTIGERYAHKTVVILGQLTGIKNDIAFERRSAELEEPLNPLR